MNALARSVQSPQIREIAIIAVLSLGFGLVGIDRFLISTLYPVIAADLHLGYGDIGLITGALALAWGISALFMGNLSDHIGRRRVLTLSLIVFSLLIGASGLATGLLGLVLVRVVMGFADGAYTPVSIAATLEASAPQRRGLNIGVQQMMMPLFGLGVAPILVAMLLRVVEWRWIFPMFALPGIALALIVWKIMPASSAAPAAPNRAVVSSRRQYADWKSVLAYRNVRLAAVLMLCWLTCLITTSAFLPNYLIDWLHLGQSQMATVMSAIGLGASLGTLLLPWLSDRLGSKPVMALSSVAALLSLLALGKAPAEVGVLFGCLFLVHFFNNALIALTVGPLSSDMVPATLVATASGLVIAVGELFGGGLAPVIVGRVAQQFGIEHVLRLPIAAMAIGIVLCLMIKGAKPQELTQRKLAV